MSQTPRFIIDPARRSGKPCIRNTRITVDDVLGYLASGISEDQIVADFPELNIEEVRACHLASFEAEE